jgi:hypothetical protein
MSNVLMDSRVIGNLNGGGKFTVSGLDEDRGNVRKLGVWVTDWNIAAIKVWFDSGKSLQYGESKGDYYERVIGPGDKLVSAMLADNGAEDPKDKRLGSIRLVFGPGKEQEFHARMRRSYGTEQSIDVGSGILVGLEGRSGADIDALGLMLFQPIRSAVLRDVEYEKLSYWNDQIQLFSITNFRDENEDDAPSAWLFEGSWKKTVSSSWSTTTSAEMTFGARVEAGVPEIVTVEASFEFKVGSTFSHGTTITNEITTSWTKKGVLEPHDTIFLEAIVGTAEITPRFTAKLDLTFENNARLSRTVTGTYAGVSASKVMLKTTDGQVMPADAEGQSSRRVVPAFA